ncbi:glycosyltransferase [Halioxenophilus aromaticivorans]
MAQLEPADIASVKPAPGAQLARLGTKLVERYSQGKYTLTPSFRAGGAQYELAFVHCGIVADLLTMGRQRDFSNIAKISVCYISELWASQLPLKTEFLHRLQCFDAVFIGCAGPVEELSKQIGRPCYYLPPAVDALASCPYPDLAGRCIDFLSVGRRPEQIHRSLLAHSQTDQLFFYLRDTVRGLAKAEVVTTQDHRQQLLSFLKRSKYFLANRPKFDQPLGANDHEVGYRFFEGAAAGCVMIGDAPRNQAFDALFGWPDVVIPNPEDPSKIIDLYRELESDPERVARIRQRNVVESLRRHDWAYRWQTLLDTVGLAPTDALTQRLEQLASLADSVEQQG